MTAIPPIYSDEAIGVPHSRSKKPTYLLRLRTAGHDVVYVPDLKGNK